MINELRLHPHFIVPPQCEQARLFMERTENEGEAFLRTFKLVTDEGAQYISPAVYFGSLLVYEKGEAVSFDEGDLGRRVAADLGFAYAPVLRIDYACTDERAYFLRAGEPKGKPNAYSVYGPETNEFVEDYIEEYLLFTTLWSALMERGTLAFDDNLLFEGEERYYEGYLGDEGLPLEVKKSTDSHLYEIDGGFMVISCEEI